MLAAGGRCPGVRVRKEASAPGTERANRKLAGRKSERKGGEHSGPGRSLMGFWLFSGFGLDLTQTYASLQGALIMNF